MLGLGAIGAWFSGSLGRWLNPDTWKAILSAVAVIVVFACLMSWHNDTKAQATAVAAAACDQKWMSQQIAANKKVDDDTAVRAQAQAEAADIARLNAQAERDQAIAQRVDLETQLQKLKDDPTVWPQDVARSMRK